MEAMWARQDADRDAADLAAFPPQTEAEIMRRDVEADGTVEHCEACGTLTAVTPHGLCPRCTDTVDEFDR